MRTSVSAVSEAVVASLAGIKGVVSVLLTGSCGRGEETYFVGPSGQRQLLSDFELLVIVRTRGARSLADSALRQLRSSLLLESESPFFDLDWSFATPLKLRAMDRRFIHFETKSAASAILGPDLTNLMPTVTVGDLNYAELGSVVVHRLYHVARDWYHLDDHARKYLVARNALDLATVILPYHGILLPTYNRRVEALDSLDLDGIWPGLADRLRRYLEMKLDYDSELYATEDSAEMMRQFADDFESVLEFLRARNGGSAFRVDARSLFSAVARGRLVRVAAALQRPAADARLCVGLLQYLRGGEADPELERAFAASMRLHHEYV